MNDITKWWLEYMPLTDYEKLLINKVNISNPILTDDFTNIEDKYFSLMPFSNISSQTHYITFSYCATDFINGLFDKYVDDNTLVVCSNNEHNNVKKRVETCKNNLIADYYTEILRLKTERIVKEAKKYKKVFVYMIGTQISTGEMTPQMFFEKLKKDFMFNNIDSIFVLDDVHGMFLTPRDYSLFDYVLYTAHALIRGFDMGLMISKDKCLGFQAKNWGEEYLEMLDIILKRIDKMRIFSQIMEQEFYKYLLMDNISLCKFTAPHIFSLKINDYKFTQKMYDMLDANEIRIEGINNNNTYLRFRAQQYIKCPEYLTNGLKLVYNILNNSENISK